MKNIVWYALLMAAIILILPFFITRGCILEYGSTEDKITEDSGVKINVYLVDQSEIKQMDIEEYVTGVVAAEMPASFELEYAYARIIGNYEGRNDVHFGADVCTDPGHCQAWISKDDVYKKWGLLNAALNWNKICKAVKETESMIITYNNIIANPVFHACSGGKTENAEEVWEGNDVPYLQSVISTGEEASPVYKKTVEINTENFIEKLRENNIEVNPNNTILDIKIKNTEGGGVETVSIGNTIIKGTEMRKIFSLNSTKFEILPDNAGNILITTYGNGHGVGMSQWGANHIAENGATYDEILKYYYTGIVIKSINEYKNISK